MKANILYFLVSFLALPLEFSFAASSYEASQLSVVRDSNTVYIQAGAILKNSLDMDRVVAELKCVSTETATSVALTANGIIISATEEAKKTGQSIWLKIDTSKWNPSYVLRIAVEDVSKVITRVPEDKNPNLTKRVSELEKAVDLLNRRLQTLEQRSK